MSWRRSTALLVLAAGLLAGCEDASETRAENATDGPVTTADQDGPVAAGSDVTNLPIGTAISDAPEGGAVFACSSNFGGGGAQATGEWIHDDGTWDATAKPTVDGEVAWESNFEVAVDGDTRTIRGNGLPSHATGTYPVASSDDAYAFDRNPNTISEQSTELDLPAVPELADASSCLSMGPIGILLSGAPFFNALDALGRDAVAYEIQDACEGHPERSGAYHYHGVTPCFDDSGDGHSALVGYAFDGFGVFGHRGEAGEMLTNADLDECHGHTHGLAWDGAETELFHYHATFEYPYTLGCFRGVTGG